jgi:P27 family predicted phage terminase small subunit
MGLRGPLPKAKLELVGNNYQRPETTVRQQRKEPLPKMPTGLSKEAKSEWRRVARPLYEMGLLTRLDVKTLALYCECVARYERCQAALLERGDTFIQPNGVPKQRPEYYIMQNCLKELRAFIALFGLSPSARMRLQLPEQQEPDAMDDLLD